MEIKTYNSFDEMMEAERKAREAADARVQPWQLKSKAGEILVSDPGYGFAIFHEILDNEKLVSEGFKKYGDDFEEEGISTLDTYCFSPKPCNYRFCNNYSVVCPYGELGDMHLSIAVGKITKKDFDELKENDFEIVRPIELHR